MKSKISKCCASVLTALILAVNFFIVPLAKTEYAVPKLILTSSEVKGGSVEAGKEFDLKLNFRNESKTSKINNISLKFASEDNQIVPVNGSDSYYIEKLGKEEETSVELKFKAKGDLKQNRYTLAINYSYEDKHKNTFTDSSSVSIPVTQPLKISVSEKKMSRDKVVLGGKSNLTFKINNLAKDTIYNSSVDIKGDSIKDITFFTGNIEPGMSGYVDVSLVSAKEGDSPIVATIIYEDAEGKKYESKEEFGLVVEKMAVPELDGPMVESAGIDPLYIAIGGGIVLVVIVIVVVRAIKRRRE